MTAQRLIHVASLASACGILAVASAHAQYDRYGRHEVAAAVAAPDCRATHVVCVTDSTRHYSSECCMSSSSAQWLIFPALGDSLEFFGISRKTNTYLTLAQPGHRSWQEHLPGLTAPFLRIRFSEAGPYVLTVDLDSDDSAIGLPYELRIRTMVGSDGSSSSPTLTIKGTAKTRVQVRPADPKIAASSWAKYGIQPGTYRVFAPGLDSLEVCGIPCRRRRIVDLRSAHKLTVQP